MLHSALPRESQCVQKHEPAAQWSITDYLLWTIEFEIRQLQWSMVDKKGRRGATPPKPLPTPKMRAENIKRKTNAEQAKERIKQIIGLEKEV